MRNEPLEPYSWPEEPLFCARCGTTIAADDLFCARCGQKMEKKGASPGWGWYVGLLLLAIALLLCILGIGALGAYHGLEERYRLNRGAALTDYRWGLAHSRKSSLPLASPQSGEAILWALYYAEGWYLWPSSHEVPPAPQGKVASRRAQTRRRGSKASRRPSPSRLKPKTVSIMATPGGMITHQAPLARNL